MSQSPPALKLLACPDCSGGYISRQDFQKASGRTFRFFCNTCGKAGPQGITTKDAMELWNLTAAQER